MHRRFAPAVIATATLLAWPACAQQVISGAEPVRIVITKVDCSRLMRHTPAADVAYRPGEGAGGRQVAPADLPGSGAEAMGKVLPDVLEFPVTINPVAYGARNQAYRGRAAAEQGAADTHAAKTAAETALSQLAREKASLDAQATALAAQRVTLVTRRDTAATELAAMQSEIDAGTRARSDLGYMRKKREVADAVAAVTAKQTEINANGAQLTANASATARQQAIVSGAPAKDAGYAADKARADATLAGISARGLDGTSMPVGTVRYDVAKGAFTFNDQPLGSAEQQELARACARQGVR